MRGQQRCVLASLLLSQAKNTEQSSILSKIYTPDRCASRLAPVWVRHLQRAACYSRHAAISCGWRGDSGVVDSAMAVYYGYGVQAVLVTSQLLVGVQKLGGRGLFLVKERLQVRVSSKFPLFETKCRTVYALAPHPFFFEEGSFGSGNPAEVLQLLYFSVEDRETRTHNVCGLHTHGTSADTEACHVL